MTSFQDTAWPHVHCHCHLICLSKRGLTLNSTTECLTAAPPGNPFLAVPGPSPQVTCSCRVMGPTFKNHIYWTKNWKTEYLQSGFLEMWNLWLSSRWLSEWSCTISFIGWITMQAFRRQSSLFLPFLNNCHETMPNGFLLKRWTCPFCLSKLAGVPTDGNTEAVAMDGHRERHKQRRGAVIEFPTVKSPKLPRIQLRWGKKFPGQMFHWIL